MTLLEAQQTRVNLAAHPHTTLGAIAAKDSSYLGWLTTQAWLDWITREAVVILCVHHAIPVKSLEVKKDPRQRELF